MITMWNNSSHSPRGSFNYTGHPTSIWYWCLRGVIALIAISGNSLVIYIIITRRQLWTRQNCFVLSLCIADLCTGIVNTPLEFTCTLVNTCDMWLVQAVKDIFLLGSVLNLCTITLDRYIAVQYSLKYYLMLTKYTCTLLLVITWALSAATPFIFYVIIQSNKLKTYRVISTIRLFLCQMVPMVGLLAAFLAMLRISQAQQRKVVQQKRQINHNYSATNASSLNAQRSSVHLVGIMVLFFVACYALTCYRSFSHYVLFTDVPQRIVSLSRLLYYLNSALDFAVYALVKGDIRREIRKVSRRVMRYAVGESVTSAG